MNFKPSFTSFLFSLIILISCKKESKPVSDCSRDELTVRQIIDQQATVKSVNSTFYIIEKGSIDTQLRPCNLSKEFQVDDLPVIISGDVKGTLYGPCCTANFVITKISK